MATMNGVTPEVMANDIIKAATENKSVVVSGTSFQKLTTVVRYLNRDKISARSEKWFRESFDRLVTDAVETLITAREKAITDYMAKKELDDRNKAFAELCARGTAVQDAYKQVFGK